MFVDNITIGAWQKANAITGVANGATITRWNDAGKNGNNMTSVTGNPILYTSTLGQLINFNPVVNFTEDFVNG